MSSAACLVLILHRHKSIAASQRGLEMHAAEEFSISPSPLLLRRRVDSAGREWSGFLSSSDTPTFSPVRLFTLPDEQACFSSGARRHFGDACSVGWGGTLFHKENIRALQRISKEERFSLSNTSRGCLRAPSLSCVCTGEGARNTTPNRGAPGRPPDPRLVSISKQMVPRGRRPRNLEPTLLRSGQKPGGPSRTEDSMGAHPSTETILCA